MPLFAENASNVITEFKIDGLKKTQEFIIQHDLKKFIGKEADEKTMHEIETVMQSQGVFEKVEVEKSETEDGTVINFNVKEKISLIPLPLVASTNGKTTAGAFVIDSNFLGLRDMLMLGAIYSKGLIMAMTAFQQPPRGLRPGFSIFAGYSRQEKEIADIYDDTLAEVDMNAFSCSFSITEKLFDVIELSPVFGIGKCELDSDGKAETFFKGNLESKKSIFYGGDIKFSSSDWNGIFMSTNSCSIKCTVNHKSQKPETSISVSLQIPFFIDSLRLTEDLGFYDSEDDHFTSYNSDENAKVSLMSKNFISRFMYGGKAGLECAVLKAKYALVSVYGNYQYAGIEDYYGKIIKNHGAGAGLKIYLSKLALPAMAMGVTYNATENFFNSTFALGMSF